MTQSVGTHDQAALERGATSNALRWAKTALPPCPLQGQDSCRLVTLLSFKTNTHLVWVRSHGSSPPLFRIILRASQLGA